MDAMRYLCPCIPRAKVKDDFDDNIEASYQDTVVHGDSAMLSSKIMSIENYDAYVLPNKSDRSRDDLVLVPSLRPGEDEDSYMDVVVAGEGAARNENNQYLYYRADAETE